MVSVSVKRPASNQLHTMPLMGAEYRSPLKMPRLDWEARAPFLTFESLWGKAHAPTMVRYLSK